MRSIWAVAKNTIKQALRMKVAVVFIVLLLVLLPVLGMTTTGDETLKGRLQTFVSYGLSLTSLLLCILTIIVSVYTVTSDIKHRQIYTVVTKPIRRYQFLLGKLFGIMMLDVILLALFSAFIYAYAVYMPKKYKADHKENPQVSNEITQVNNEFFTARAALVIPEIDVTREVNERYQELKGMDRLPDLPYEQIISELTEQAKVRKRTSNIGQKLIWEFDNVKPLTKSMFIRFKYDVAVTPPDMQVFGMWYAGDPNYVKYGQQPETPYYENILRHSVQTFHEIEFPANVVPKSGHLAIAFMNIYPNNTSIIFPDDGLAVLYKADTFTANFVRAVFLILFRLFFLACLGILASTFVSFPVAILMCLVLFSTAAISGFVIESFDSLSSDLNIFYSYSIKWMIRFLPQFDKFSPTEFIVSARLLSWSILARCAVSMVFIKSFILLALSFIIFRYREIAKIIV
ncbi:MAG: hypothetical protein JW715_12995 [Sedimentisphaerales bacterium]|nr:hypothetical protein [Sedimentisphaerales bacterium]